jgi:hypothetical protein
MIDSSIVRAHAQAATGKGAPASALGRSRGGLSTRIHLAVDNLGRPVRVLLTGGQRNDTTQAQALLAGFALRRQVPHAQSLRAMPCTTEAVAPRGHALRPQIRQPPHQRLDRLHPHLAECRFCLGQKLVKSFLPTVIPPISTDDGGYKGLKGFTELCHS